MRPSFTRQWKHPEGYKNLAIWQNAALLRILIRKFTATLPTLNKPLSTLNQPSEHRLVTQLNDAARSFKRNIEEGYKRPTTKEYLDFLGFSQASLEEVKGDIRDCRDDRFLKARPGSCLKDVGIDLGGFKGWNRPLRVDKGGIRADKGIYGEPTEPRHPYYQALQTLKVEDLTYEMFMEIINKSDWLIQKLVKSLETRMDQKMPMSARDKWLRRKWQKERQEDREFDRKMLEEVGLVFTVQGVMSKDKAQRLGLEPIDIP